MKKILQGRAIRHPLHPFLVHFPIGLFLFSFLLDLASILFAGEMFVRGAFYAMALGLVTALGAAVPGLVDYSDIRRDHPARRLATFHMLLNFAAVALYAINLGARYGELDLPKTSMLGFGLSMTGMLLLSISGYLGGAMVYDHGIGVGRHRRKTDTPRQTIVVQGEAGARPVLVGDLDLIGERQTLRVDLDGQIVTIAREGGELYAFQEFCTHRYGPLSEGAVCDGRVQCPWHRSVFDLRTGHVIQGPAKVPLRTFPVEVRNGRIYLHPRASEPGQKAA